MFTKVKYCTAIVWLLLGCKDADPCDPITDPLTEACVAKRVNECADLGLDHCGERSYCFVLPGQRLDATAACWLPSEGTGCMAYGPIMYPITTYASDSKGQEWKFSGHPLPRGWVDFQPTGNTGYPDCPPQ
jgi:hypothetical protein